MNEYLELIITVFGGWLGLHRFIRKEKEIGTIYFFSLGLFGVGWIFDIACCLYYMSKNFKNIKNSIVENTQKCNDLNEHIEELKSAYANIERKDYGSATYSDASAWKYKRPELNKIKDSRQVVNCSASVIKGANDQPFKYVCKYFDIQTNEESLANFEQILNNFCAAEQGKKLLKAERDDILESISAEIPFLIRKLDNKNLINKLGFDTIDFSQLYFPKYSFRYVSSGGNSSRSCDVVLDINQLERFVNYLSGLVKFKNSVKGQRALMTVSLREKIKQRDNHTCKICGNSTYDEPNLLLEIDHIIPLSKEGMTTEDNLQTLCWKCNRSKGAKIL